MKRQFALYILVALLGIVTVTLAQNVGVYTSPMHSPWVVDSSGNLSTTKSVTIGTTYSLVPVLTGQSGAVSIDAAYCKNGYVEFSGAGTGTLPAGVAGYAITVRNVGAHAVSVKPNGVETLTLNGTALAGGNKATNTSTANDSITLIYTGATWVILGTSTWTDGGA